MRYPTTVLVIPLVTDKDYAAVCRAYRNYAAEHTKGCGRLDRRGRHGGGGAYGWGRGVAA